MKPPVLVICFNRPELLVRRLNELAMSSVLPNQVIVSIDGPRNSDEAEIWNNFNFIGYEGKYSYSLKFVRRSKNLGCTNHIITAVTEVIDEYRKVIVVEDDVVVGTQFIESMITGFTIISSNDSIGTVGGFSPFHKGLIPLARNYWRKSPYFSAWGWGTTKKFWDNFVPLNEINDIEHFLETSSNWMNMTERKKRIWLTRFHRGVWDYNVQFILFHKNQKNLLPKFRLIDNEGFSDSRSTHTKHQRPWSLFGEGYSSLPPQNIAGTSSFSLRSKIWSWVDSNLWAADGHFNSRARGMGIRTLLRKILSF